VTDFDDYLHNPMRPSADLPLGQWPLPDETHVSWWRERVEGSGSVLDRIGQSLPQVRIGIGEGVSKRAGYAAAVRRGEPLAAVDLDIDVPFQQPDAIELSLHPHYAGSLPVLETPNRADFVRLYRALAGRCEPIPVSDGVHAVFVSGLPNPGRTRSLKKAWQSHKSGEGGDWPSEMKRLLREDRAWFYDRLVLLQTGPYGNLAAEHVSPGLSEEAWVECSTRLRCEHEFTHYATNRMLGSFRLNLHDELIADFMGFTEALATFSAELFVAAMGVDGEDIPEDARFRHYTGELSEDEIRLVLDLATRAASSLEALAAQLPRDVSRASLLLALAEFGLRDLAHEGLPDRALALLGEKPGQP